MAVSIGRTYAWRDGITHVLISRNDYRPGIGDILYVKTESGYILLQVSGFEGEIPVSPTSFIAKEGYSQYTYGVEKTTLAKTIPIFEIRDIRSGNEVRSVVIRPSQPPPLDVPVYVLKSGDEESENIMSLLSHGIPKKEDNAVPIAWLRAGIASVKELTQEKYFRNACLKLNLNEMIPKHVLISGQTGSGKTTSVMGIITQWCRYGENPISWIIADRHGEYSGTEKFVDVLSKALRLNERLRGSYSGIYIYTFKTNVKDSGRQPLVKVNVTHSEGSLDAASVNIYDVINAAGLFGKDVSELLEITSVLATLIKNASEIHSSQHSESVSVKKLQQTKEHKISESCVRVFIDKNENPTGNLLALIPLITSNVVRYEGVREPAKKGIYKVLVDAGIYVNTLRDFRRMILSVFGWREKTENLVANGKKVPVNVIDDENSVFKVSPILKDPQSLATLLNAIVDSAVETFKVPQASYPWKDVKGSEFSKLASGALDLSNIYNELDKGVLVILDVSKLPLFLGDMIIISVLRRLFEERMLTGVEEARKKPVVAVVSEEAPLYLSPEKVSSPYNIFARLAREGRKFGIGLIALSQVATMIEKQILANFNTLIALRTKHRSDIDYMSNIGIPAEALPSLSDREGFLYTPDLSVSEPIPVYVPAYFDFEEEIKEEFNKEVREKDLERVPKVLLNEVSEDEDSRS
ncbi:MAG: DUF87 domain-containing protein [Desulfurococcaceae archaeon TW002]